MLSHHLQQQYERLRRRYIDAAVSLDVIAMWEMCAALRIFCDEKRELTCTASRESKVFGAFHFNRKCLPSHKESEYFYLPLASGVQVPGVYTRSVLIKLRHRDSASEKFPWIAEPLSNKYLSFEQWLSVPAVYGAYFTDGKRTEFFLTREVLIRRVANNLGASHADKNENRHPEDAAVRWLLEGKVLGHPIPYFALLEIASDILNGFSKFVDKPFQKPDYTGMQNPTANDEWWDQLKQMEGKRPGQNL